MSNWFTPERLEKLRADGYGELANELARHNVNTSNTYRAQPVRIPLTASPEMALEAALRFALHLRLEELGQRISALSARQNALDAAQRAAIVESAEEGIWE